MPTLSLNGPLLEDRSEATDEGSRGEPLGNGVRADERIRTTARDAQDRKVLGNQDLSQLERFPGDVASVWVCVKSERL